MCEVVLPCDVESMPGAESMLSDVIATLLTAFARERNLTEAQKRECVVELMRGVDSTLSVPWEDVQRDGDSIRVHVARPLLHAWVERGVACPMSSTSWSVKAGVRPQS